MIQVDHLRIGLDFEALILQLDLLSTAEAKAKFSPQRLALARIVSPVMYYSASDLSVVLPIGVHREKEHAPKAGLHQLELAKGAQGCFRDQLVIREHRKVEITFPILVVQGFADWSPYPLDNG